MVGESSKNFGCPFGPRQWPHHVFDPLAVIDGVVRSFGGWLQNEFLVSVHPCVVGEQPRTLDAAEFFKILGIQIRWLDFAMLGPHSKN